jgi:DNA-binding MarR family transcriptional regulator
MTCTETPTELVLERIAQNWPEAMRSEMRLSILVQRLARLVHQQARDVLAAHALSTTEFEILAALRSASPPHMLTPSELYTAALLSSGGTTKLLKQLEARGLVDRPASRNDGRSRPVRLTPHGRDCVERAMVSVQQADAELLGLPHDKTRIAELGALLERVLSQVEKVSRPELAG